MSVDRDRPFCELEIGVPAGAGTLASVALAVVCVRPVRWLERGAQNPIPSRTRPLNASALMVLRPKARESRSPPGQPNAKIPFYAGRAVFARGALGLARGGAAR